MDISAARTARPRAAFATAVAATLVLGTAAPAAADDEHDLVLDEGIACADFAVGLDFLDGKRNRKEFTDADGNVVGVLVTGTGAEVVVTNTETGTSVTAPSRGAVFRVEITGEGTSTETHTGNLLLVLFPTDVPAGPTTTLIQGRTVFTVDEAGVFTVQSITGRTTDICAALA